MAIKATSYQPDAPTQLSGGTAAAAGADEPTDSDLQRLLSSPDKEADSDADAEIEVDSLTAAKGRRTTDLVRLYLQEIGRVRLLERDEEVEEAQLVQGYMRLLEERDRAAEA